MAIPFLKKKEPVVIVGKGYIPVDRVREMSSRGFIETEIIEALRKEGFSADEIDKALTQALKSGISSPQPIKQVEKKEEELPSMQSIEEERRSLEIPETSLPSSYSQESYSLEDYIDYIIEFRIDEVNEKINEINSNFLKLSDKLEKISKKVDELSQSGLAMIKQKDIASKLEEVTQSFNDISSRVSGLEKAFKETLPALIESVRSLSDIIQRIKKES